MVAIAAYGTARSVSVCKVTNDETNLFLLPSSPTFSSSWSVGTRLFRLDFLGTVGMLMRKENRGKCRLSLLAPSVVEFKGMTKLFNYRKDTKIAQLCRHVCLTAKTTRNVLLCFQVSAVLFRAILSNMIRGKGDGDFIVPLPVGQKLPPIRLKFGICPGMTNMLFLACKLEDRSLNNNQVRITLCNLKSKFLSFYKFFYFDWNKNSNFDTQGSIVM